jgi:hypothetical protein
MKFFEILEICWNFGKYIDKSFIAQMFLKINTHYIGEASPSLFPRFAPNTHIYLYASTVHMYCIYPAI